MKQLLLFLLVSLIGACSSEAIEKDNTMAPRVPKTGWSTSGSLQPGNPGAQGVTLQAQFPIKQTYTVQLNIKDPNKAVTVGNEVIVAQAEIQWSVEGNTVSRLVDCVNGISVTGTAEAVTVKVTDRSTITIPNKRPYIVSINVAPGTRADVSQPPIFTAERQRLDGGLASGSVEVPAGAVSAMINVSGILIGQDVVNPDDYIVRQTANGGRVLKSYSPFRYTGWIPLAAGCTLIRFEQAAVVSSNWYWFTTFGIDG